jgi:hypothetical protein
MKYKKYRVYLDRPECGWEIIVKAKNAKNALINANLKNKYNPTTINNVEELTNRQIKLEKVLTLNKEYKRKLNDLKTEYEIQKRIESVLYSKKLNKLK